MSKTYPAESQARPVALVVHCGDPRFQAAFRQFIAGELKLKDGEFVPVVIAGGTASLAEPMSMPKEFKTMREMVTVYVAHFGSIQRIVLINHENCGKYAAVAALLGPLFHATRGTEAFEERVQADLGEVKRLMRHLLPRPVEIDLYYAHFTSPERTGVIFDKIA